ncbi:serine/arginine-rich splicing factor RSZ23-like [Lycium barbarum]|uniref:serine/arginine-rich splicing factor RSZ23-like n=1 Tax=Lycium barbarum TaxID=112863 RepID=UPI00293E4842|nr:serine/arginine-rich splicing factor RSZ23-like [Lycium barbarum]
MQDSVRGLSRASLYYSGQPGGSQDRAPYYGGYSTFSAFVKRPTLDLECFECGKTGHFKRNYPRLRQGGQGTQFQTPRAPASSREGGSYGSNRSQSGRGGHTTGRGGTQPNRGEFRSSRGRYQPDKVEL